MFRFDELEQKTVETLQYIHDIRPEKAGSRTTRPSIPVSEEQKLALGGFHYYRHQSLFKHGRFLELEYIGLCNQQHTGSFIFPLKVDFFAKRCLLKPTPDCCSCCSEQPCSTNCLEICIDDKPFSCKAGLNGYRNISWCIMIIWSDYLSDLL